MKHLEFVDELNKLGISIRHTDIENHIRRYEIYGFLNESTYILAKNFKLKWEHEHYDNHMDCLKSLLGKAIDFDSWKHSWHLDIKPDNYPVIEDIIQKEILNRANQVDELMSVLNQLRHEMSSMNYR